MLCFYFFLVHFNVYGETQCISLKVVCNLKPRKKVNKPENLEYTALLYVLSKRMFGLVDVQCGGIYVCRDAIKERTDVFEAVES